MRLPNAERAFADVRKLREYCLDPEHPRGRHKARVFLATAGLGPEHAEQLRADLLGAHPGRGGCRRGSIRPPLCGRMCGGRPGGDGRRAEHLDHPERRGLPPTRHVLRSLRGMNHGR
jgi:hypothetical protein